MNFNLFLSFILLFYLFDKSLSEFSSLSTNFVSIKHVIEFYTLQSSSERSQLCENQTKLLYNGVSNSEIWAERLIGASAKLPNEITKLSRSDFGYFDECIQTIDESVPIKGKYCLTTFSQNMTRNESLFDNEVKMNWAICVPNGCTAKEVEDHLNTFTGIDLFKLHESKCQTIDTYKSKLNIGDWLVIVALSILCVIILLSTIYDVSLYYRKRERDHQSIFIAFSWFKNFENITKINNNPNMLPCLNGIRFLSILWIIYGHQYEHMFSSFNANIMDFYRWRSTFPAMLILGFTVSVDSFFLLSGCLVMYGFLKMQANKKPFNIAVFYLHRYIRLTPSYAAVIVCLLTLYRFMGSGPLWDPENTNEPCKQYWWAALLYIQNYVTDRPCVLVSWYLQVEVQLFLLAPLLLVPIAKWPKITSYFLSLLVLVFVIIPTAIAWHFSFPALEEIGNDGSHDPNYDRFYYTQIYTRAGPWILGLLLGHILFHTKNKRIIMNKISVISSWIVSLSLMLYTIFGFYHQTEPDYEYDRVFNALFVGFHRIVWAAGLSWIIFACVHGYGGPINWFLSLPIFHVLGRLTYSIFLIHYSIQDIRLKSLQMPFIFSNMNVWYSYCGTVFTTVIVSLFWTLTFETPFLVLDTLLIKSVGDLFSKRSTQISKNSTNANFSNTQQIGLPNLNSTQNGV